LYPLSIKKARKMRALGSSWRPGTINGAAAGLFVQSGDVKVVALDVAEATTATDAAQPEALTAADTSLSDTVQEAVRLVEVSGLKALAHRFQTRDKAGKPIMQIREPRIRLERGARLTVSATRSESSKDKGDGIIHATGNIEFFFVLDQPSNGEAAGLYIKAEDVKTV